MKNICRMHLSFLAVCAVLAGCAGTGNMDEMGYNTPTVDYVEGLNVNDAPHQESFLNQLAMNYRSYALYNARTSGYPEIAELFAQKAVGAFSGETPYPESLDNWKIRDEGERFEIYTAYNDLIDELKNDAALSQPQLAAETQAKFDCWISAASSGQNATARECEKRFKATMQALIDCDGGRVVEPTHVKSENVMPIAEKPVEERYYPETRRLNSMAGAARTREGVVIVNNVNVPPALVQTVPVPMVAPQKQQSQQNPIVFTQNIYGGDETVNGGSDTFDNSDTYTVTDSGNYTNSNSGNYTSTSTNTTTSSCEECAACSAGKTESETCEVCNQCSLTEGVEYHEHEGYVSREEFIDLMVELRKELAAINARLDGLAEPGEPTPVNVPVSVHVSTPQQAQSAPAPTPIILGAPSKSRTDKTVIKVQQIPLEPRQRIMEEIFEIRFDFDKAMIKPEYDNIIKQLAATTQANKNVKVSVVGHTDTAGSAAYNYALGGRRAEAVQKMLIEYGIPASQIIAVSAGEEDLKVPTPNNTPNAENRRVRVVKEVQYLEQPKQEPVVVEKIEEIDDCQECDR